MFDIDNDIKNEIVKKRFVELTAFALMPNHFHLIVKETKEGGMAYMKGLVVDTLEIGTTETPSGITIYDKITKEPYCWTSENGEIVRTKGKCEIIENTTPPQPLPEGEGESYPPPLGEAGGGGNIVTEEPIIEQPLVEQPVVEEPVNSPLEESPKGEVDNSSTPANATPQEGNNETPTTVEPAPEPAP